MACQRKQCNKACRDQNGYTHQVGDRFLSGKNSLKPCVWFDLGRWKHECNSCSCLSGGVVKCSKDQCTKKCKDEQGYTHQVNVSLKRLSDSLTGWRHLEQGVRQQLQVHCQRAGGVHKEPLQVQGRAGVHPPSGRPVDQPVQELHLWIRGESLLQADRLQEHLHR